MTIMNNSDGIKRYAVAYVRISDKKQISGESPQTQRKVIGDYAAGNNIEIVEWFFDEAKSGKNTDRKELLNLLKFVKKNSKKIDLVIVYKLNRGSRDALSYYVGVKAILEGEGIAIRSASEPMVDDTPIGRFLEGMMVLNGQLDNEVKGSTTIDNMRSLARQGYWQHGPMIGYDKHTVFNGIGKPRPSMKPNAMAPLVKRVLERFAEGDINPVELMRYSHEIGLKTAGYTKNDGTRISPKLLGKNGIYGLIQRPEYAGFVHDKLTDNELVEGKHQAIITPELYWHNQKLVNRKAKFKVAYSKRNTIYVLKDTLLCSGCGRPYYGSAPQTGGGKSHSPRYHCYRSDCNGSKKQSIGTQEAHEAYLALLKQIQPTDSFLKGYKEILIRQATKENDRLNSKVSGKRTQLDGIATTRLSTIRESVSATGKRKQELGDLLEGLDIEKLTAIDELDELLEKQAVQESKVKYAIKHMRNIDKQWLDADYDLRLRFQSMVFPEGTTLDIATMHFGTDKISPLYRYAPNKKDLTLAEKSSLVTPAGFEPAIFRMRT
jgi:site-specific DNA recombinase